MYGETSGPTSDVVWEVGVLENSVCKGPRRSRQSYDLSLLVKRSTEVFRRLNLDDIPPSTVGMGTRRRDSERSRWDQWWNWVTNSTSEQ